MCLASVIGLEIFLTGEVVTVQHSPSITASFATANPSTGTSRIKGIVLNAIIRRCNISASGTTRS